MPLFDSPLAEIPGRPAPGSDVLYIAAVLAAAIKHGQDGAPGTRTMETTP